MHKTDRSGLRRVGGHFVDADGFLPFGGDGVAFFHRHRGVLQKHLRAFAAAPGEEVDEMVLADGLGAGGGVRAFQAIGDAAAGVMHGVPRVMDLSMPDGLSYFQRVFFPGERSEARGE